FEKPFERRALLDEVRKRLPVIPPPPQDLAFDVEAGPEVSEPEPEIQLTGRVAVTSSGTGPATLKGGGPIQLKSIDRELAARLGAQEPTAPQRVASRNVVEPAPTEEPPGAVPMPPEALRPLQTDG